MEKKFKTIFFINLIFIFIILSIPGLVIYAEFANFNRIDKSLEYTYFSQTPPFEQKLNIYADLGTIDIKYISQQVDYLIRIEVNIEMAGPNLYRKSHIDFFNISWDNSTSPLNFILKLKSDILLDYMTLHVANININIMLRADIIFDVNTSVMEGVIKYEAPIGITVGNLFLNMGNGDIFYSITHSNVVGNITGIVNYGDITLKTYDTQYTQDCKLTLINEVGYITFDIYQNEIMGANITGTGITKTGIISVIYKDFSSNIGARFVFYNKTTHGVEGQNSWIGFERDILPLSAGQYYNSTDFPAQNNYNFSFYKWDDGDYLWNLYSIPI